MKQAPDPIKEHEEVADNPDNKIDEDFKGFPHGTAAEKLINPESEEDKKAAAVNITDGEKVNKNKEEDTDEQQSNGSGGAFGATENMGDD